MYVHDVISKRKTCIDNKVYARVDSMILTFHGKPLARSQGTISVKWENANYWFYSALPRFSIILILQIGQVSLGPIDTLTLNATIRVHPKSGYLIQNKLQLWLVFMFLLATNINGLEEQPLPTFITTG